MTRNDFLNVFAGWLVGAGHADSWQQATRIAWDYVTPAWDWESEGKEDGALFDWIAAYEQQISEAEPV